ncbi:Short-chain dehydrogenase/reductase [Sphaerulina musiva]
MAGKVFAITGGASGIGLAAAKLLVERGAKVSIADVSSKLNEAAVEIAQHAGLPQDQCVLARSVDVRELSQIQAWLKATVETFGRLDGAVNSAGVFDYPKAATGQTAALWHQERGIDQWNHVIGVNLTGTANCCHVELEYMTSEAAKAENWGRSIVNMTSVAGFRARGGSPAYIAGKHGIIGLTKALAKQYGPVGVNINAVAPGAIDTPMNQNVGKEFVDAMVAGLPIPRRGTAEETAKMIVYLLSDDASYVTGATLTIDGGMTV